MAKYKIIFDDAQAGVLRGLSQTIDGYDDRLKSIVNGMDVRDGTMAALQQQVRTAAATIPPLAARVRCEGEVWRQAVALYRQAEQTAAKGLQGAKITVPAPAPVAGGVGSCAKEAVGEVGPKWLDPIGAIGAGVGFIGDTAGGLMAGAGMTLGANVLKSSGFVGSVAIGAIASGVSNYNDVQAGKIDVNRAVMGTILETGIMALVGIGIAVGTAALIGNPVGWGVLGVAAISAGINIGLDTLTGALTGKGFAKWASDTVLDGLRDLMSPAVNCFTNVTKCCGNWGQAVLGFIF
ncbi:MAG: hypothetical protein LBS10_10495 [Gracilibacteraceae bacterium]|jgi:hypothetical protein|nr:hypothetical protein [Gracilibacteraceae bacterium]